MKHKVKLVSVKKDIITLRVDGALCSYLIQRPQPLNLSDASMLRGVMDNQILESLVRSSGYVSPQESLYQKFCRLVGSWRHKNSVLLSSFDAVADYIEKVGVEVNIDKKTKGVVILKSDVDKIRKGGE